MALVGLIEGEWPDRPKAEHFLSGFAAGVARLALGKGSARGRRGAVPRAAPVALRARDGVDRHPGRRSARGAFDVHRRDPAGETGDERGGRSRFLRRSRSVGSRRPGVAFDAGRAVVAGRGCISRPDRTARSEDVVGQRARDLPRLPVQVLRAARRPARGRARRRRGDGSAHAGAVRARGVRSVLQALARRRTPGDHAGHDRHGADAVSRRRRGISRQTVRHGSGARADSTARISGGRRPWRGRVSDGSRTLGSRGGPPARAPTRRTNSPSRRRPALDACRSAAKPIGSTFSPTARSG